MFEFSPFSPSEGIIACPNVLRRLEAIAEACGEKKKEEWAEWYGASCRLVLGGD